MPSKKGKDTKAKYMERFLSVATKYDSVVVMTIDNIATSHIQSIRKELRGRAEIIKGKNSFIRKILKNNVDKNKCFKSLIDNVNGNCSLIFTNEPPKAICAFIDGSKRQTRAKAGVVAPNDVVIPAGSTGMPPDMTSFFQMLNIPTKIISGQIEIVSNIDLIAKGKRVGNSEVELLSKLCIRPFLFGPHLISVVDSGQVFAPDIYLMADETLRESLASAVAVVAALGLALGVPNTASVAHSLRAAARCVLGAASAAGYPLAELDRLQQSAAAGPVVVDAKAAAAEAEKPAADAEEDESEDGGGIGMADLFGDSEEESGE